jgi:hypothetical protein
MALRLISERLNVDFANRWFFSNIENQLDEITNKKALQHAGLKIL